MYKKLYLSGLLVYLALLVMSVLFYLERMVFLDEAFALFHLVKDGGFVIQIFRFGDALAQLPPVVACKLGASLRTITLAYSIGFMLVPIACYLVCGAVLRQYMLALVILLINVLFAAHSFYWPIAQTPQGISLIIVLLALLWGKDTHTIRSHTTLMAIALLITIVFFHPLMTLCMLYAIVFFMLRQEEGMHKPLLYRAGLVFAGIFIIKMLFFRVQYEQHSLSGLKNIILLFPHYLDTYTNRQFLAGLPTLYYWIPIAFIIILTIQLRHRRYLQAGLSVVSIVGYLALVNTCYPNADTPPAYLEALYLPLALFLALPLIFDVLPAIGPRYAAVLLPIIMATGCYRIYATHAVYTHRLDTERSILQRYGHKKMIARPTRADALALQMLWGTPYEFWLLSTIENGYSASIILDDAPAQRPWAAEKKTALIVNWNIFDYKDLDPRYFRFTDTTTAYLVAPALK